MIDQKRKNSYLSFMTGKETFAVSVRKVLEVLEMQHITKVPNAPAYIEGVINFRGRIVPVVDSRLKFNLGKRAQDEMFVIIIFTLKIESQNMIVGAMVDKVIDMAAFDETSILEVPEHGINYNTELISGIVKNETGFTMILDVDKVFIKDEVRFSNRAGVD